MVVPDLCCMTGGGGGLQAGRAWESLTGKSNTHDIRECALGRQRTNLLGCITSDHASVLTIAAAKWVGVSRDIWILRPRLETRRGCESPLRDCVIGPDRLTSTMHPSLDLAQRHILHQRKGTSTYKCGEFSDLDIGKTRKTFFYFLVYSEARPRYIKSPANGTRFGTGGLETPYIA